MQTRCSKCRYDYRKGPVSVRQQAQSKLFPVTVTAEPNSVTLPGIAPVRARPGSIHIELPGRAVISVEAGLILNLCEQFWGAYCGDRPEVRIDAGFHPRFRTLSGQSCALGDGFRSPSQLLWNDQGRSNRIWLKSQEMVGSTPPNWRMGAARRSSGTRNAPGQF
jgi:hypothetical protein